MTKKNIKIVSLLILLISLFFISCKSENLESETNRMYFTVSEIKAENGLLNLNLIDLQGYYYTTDISNNSKLNIQVGDSISLVANKIFECYPAIIDSKDIKVEETSKDKYVKIISEVYWIKSRSLVAEKNHYFYQNSDTLDISGEWDELNTKIKYFIPRSGEYHKVKVLKKIKSNNSFDLELITVLDRILDEEFTALITTHISTDKELYQLGNPIKLTATINNNSNKSYSFLPFGTPFEDSLTNDCLKITYEGKVVEYRGILVSRIPPTDNDYIEISPNSYYTNSIDIATDYSFDKKGIYEIQIKDKFDGPSESNIIFIEIK